MEKKSYKKLEQVAQTYRKIAAYNIRPSIYYRAPYKTGNMYRRVRTYNSVQNMILSQKNPYIISLKFAPDGAHYGTYVHQGTYKMVERPFAKDAASSKEVENKIDEFIYEILDEEFEKYSKLIDESVMNGIVSDDVLSITVY